MEKIKRIWSLCLMFIVIISLGVSLYLYSQPVGAEKIAVQAVKKLRNNQPFPNKVSTNKIYIKDDYIAVDFHTLTDDGYNKTIQELWKYDNETVTYVGNDESIKVQDLPIGYLTMNSGNEKIITKIINDEDSIELNSNKINRLSK